MKAPMNQPTHRSDLSVTMRFDPEEGIANLDVYLDQLKREADAAGFKFDHHAARNELQAATFGKRTASTARLVLSPTGTMAIEVRPA
jgi:para-aminobenzoate synthetase/4-amino-4-deoxychorismate lyase